MIFIDDSFSLMPLISSPLASQITYYAIDAIYWPD